MAGWRVWAGSSALLSRRTESHVLAGTQCNLIDPEIGAGHASAGAR